MSSVLARKWRPRSFKELIGQAHIVTALTSSIQQQRLHHAYLFSGTRGVGKTTISRIIAKSLNCLDYQQEPCNQCSVCHAINDGYFPDLIEIDAASRTKVEDTREILDNVDYAPTQGKYKIYLIDEVHMLSNSSFNALLKTLEEPPAHVVFILATTDPQKVPETVLSRCLVFTLKRVGISTLANHLQTIAELESFSIDDKALLHLAKAADGSVRDGLSLLDQAIAFANDNIITQQAVEDMLGLVGQQTLIKLTEGIVYDDIETVKGLLEQLAEVDTRYAQVLATLGEIFYWVSQRQILQMVTDIESLGDYAELVEQIATNIPAERIQLLYQISIHANHDFQWAPHPKIGFEMAVMRMLAFSPHHVEPPKEVPPPKKIPRKKAEEAQQAIGQTAEQPIVQQTLTQQQSPPRAQKTTPSAQGNTQVNTESSRTAPAVESASVPKATANGNKILSALEWLNKIKDYPIKGMLWSLICQTNAIEISENSYELVLNPAQKKLLTDTKINSLKELMVDIQMKFTEGSFYETCTPQFEISRREAIHQQQHVNEANNNAVINQLSDYGFNNLQADDVIPAKTIDVQQGREG